MHISALPAARPFWGSRAASGPEEQRDSERTYASTHAYLGTAGRGTRKGPWAASGPEELRDSDSRSGHTDIDVMQWGNSVKLQPNLKSCVDLVDISLFRRQSTQ